MFRRKWLIRFGLSALLTVGLSVGGLVYDWNQTRSEGEIRRNVVVAQLDADESGWRIHDLAAARNARIPPPDENAGEQAVRAAGLIPQSYLEWERTEEWRQHLRPGVLPHDEDVCTAAAALGDAKEAVAVARTIRHLPRGGFRIVPAEPNTLATMLPHIQPVRQCAALLEIDALVLAYSGQPNDAITSAHAMLNTARGLGDEQTLIAQLVRMAVLILTKLAVERTLGWGEPTAGLAELQAALTDELRVPRLSYGLQGERAMFFRLGENLDDGLLSLEELSDGKPSLRGKLALRFYRKHIPAQQATAVELFNQMLAADKLTGPERQAAFDRIALPPPGRETILVRLLLPNYEKVNGAELRTRAQLGATIAALACERHRRKFGQFPEALADIPKDILPNVPIDPYTGKPLIYKQFKDGAAIYATGPDLTDDGGTLDPAATPGTDLGFRLLNPDQRRQPPPEKPATDEHG